METKRRVISEQDAFYKLSSLCATAEYCIADMRKKMERWEIAGDDQAAKQRIIDRLLKERYIDEERFARAFVRDKFRYNHWGAVRIAQELRMKHIDANTIEDALTEIDDSDNLDTLRELIAKKRPTVRGKSDYEIRCKLIRFAFGRGFSMDDILKVISNSDYE